jgi:hypothetical protein
VLSGAGVRCARGPEAGAAMVLYLISATESNFFRYINGLYHLGPFSPLRSLVVTEVQNRCARRGIANVFNHMNAGKPVIATAFATNGAQYGGAGSA